MTMKAGVATGNVGLTPIISVDDSDSGGAGLIAHAALLSGTHKIVACGILDMSAGPAAWIGSHPGFTNVVTAVGVGEYIVHLSADGDPIHYAARATALNHKSHAGQDGPLAGVGNRDLRLKCAHYVGAAVVGAVGMPIMADEIVIVEVLDFT